MEFLYSPNRLNVAASRARCLSVVVASPRLFVPACRSPRRMELANAFWRYLEMVGGDSHVRRDSPSPAAFQGETTEASS